MITTNAKLAIAGIGLGGASIGAATYYLINKNKEADLPTPATKEVPQSKAISDWLAEDNKVLLGSADSAEWKLRWADFKVAFPKEKAPTGGWAFTDWSKDFDKNEDGLKAKCDSQSKVTINSKSGELYEAVKKYCTKDKTPSPTPQ